MLHTAGFLGQLFALHLQLHTGLTTLDTQVVHLTIHEQIKRHSTHCYTY